MSLHLSIDTLTVETEGERRDLEQVPSVLRAALRQLGERLAALPSEQAALRGLALERLEIEVASLDEVLGDRGAERLADALFARLTERPR